MIVSYQMEERYMNIFLQGLTMGLAYVAPHRNAELICH